VGEQCTDYEAGVVNSKGRPKKTFINLLTQPAAYIISFPIRLTLRLHNLEHILFCFSRPAC